MRHLVLALAVPFAAACATAPQPKPFDHTFAPAELKADVAALRAAFDEGHAAITRWRPRPSVDSIWNALEDSAGTPMRALDFWRVVARALTGLRDGHVAVFPGASVTPQLYRSTIPFTLFVDADAMRLYVRRNLSDAERIPDGSEIVRINGLTSASFLSECLRHIPADADIRIRGLRRLTRDFELTCAPAFGVPAAWSVVVRTPAGALDSATVPSLPWGEKRRRLGVRAAEDTIRRPLGELRFLNGDSVAVLGLRSWTKQDGFDPERFIERSFEQLRERQPCNLVIDLRGNTGGSDKYAGTLFRHIARDTFTYYRERILTKKRYQFLKRTDDWVLNWALMFYGKERLPDGRYRLRLDMDKPMQPVTNSYRGTVTLLLDGDSFSTSSEFASVFRYYERGRIVGEDSPTPEIGGSGATVGLKLPNTALDVALPLVMITMPAHAATDGRGVVPDERIPRTVRQVLAIEDSALAAAARCR